jgi:hypothetical protein
LRKSPAERFQTVAELVAALAPFATWLSKDIPIHIAQLAAGQAKTAASVPPHSSGSIAPAQGGAVLPGLGALAEDAVPEDEAVTRLQAAPEDEVGFRKMTRDGRIEALDSEDAALAVRSKRVAAEAAALAKNVAAMAPDDEPREDTHSTHKVSLRPASFGSPSKAPLQGIAETIDPSAERGRATKRLIFVIVLLAAVLLGLIVGVVVRILGLRDAGQGSDDTTPTTQPSPR